jgi:hypothetical protein
MAPIREASIPDGPTVGILWSYIAKVLNIKSDDERGDLQAMFCSDKMRWHTRLTPAQEQLGKGIQSPSGRRRPCCTRADAGFNSWHLYMNGSSGHANYICR